MTEWVRMPFETKTCQFCGQGVIPQQLQGHKNACKHDMHIAEFSREQKQQETEMLHEAISNVTHNHAADVANMGEHSPPLSSGILITLHTFPS